jgi:ADP-ribosylglycohydrolase
MDEYDRYLGCMLGGATGDALGFLIEFDNLDTIRKKFGPYGLRTVLKSKSNGNRGVISDDTQMALFTADGLLWAAHDGLDPADGIYRSYMRWYYTQTKKVVCQDQADWMKRQPHEEFWQYDLMGARELFVRRAPGMTCLKALSSGRQGCVGHCLNDSKGCGTVMRAAPVGMFYAGDPEQAFRVGCQSGAITHGNPSGYLTAGVLSAIISYLVQGIPFGQALTWSVDMLKSKDKKQEVVRAVSRALDEAVSQRSPILSIERIGPGWVAEEALAIAVYCILKTDTLKDAVIMACNHDGDSDSCGAVCGNMAGAIYGSEAVPMNWTKHLECLDLLGTMADCLYKNHGQDREQKLS